MKLYAAATAVLLLACAASGNDSVKGNAFGTPRAPILMEIFSDFACPGCKQLHDTELPRLMEDFVKPGKVYLIYRYFPLEMHPYGRRAAEYVCAAAQLGKWEQAANLLFARQSIWAQDGKVEETVDTLFPPAEQKQLRELLKAPSVQAEINRDIEEGKAVPVTGTPTLLVTYRLHRYPIGGQEPFNYPLVKSFLDDLLKK
jgi:protein-disulfide isomerase